MNIFPSTPEIFLAVFTALLSLAVALFMLKIQIANSKSVKNLEDEHKILIAKQSETNKLVHSRELITSKEIQDAVDFLDNDVIMYRGEIEEGLIVLERQKKMISTKSYLGGTLLLLSLGANAYFTLHVYKNDSNAHWLMFFVVVFINALFFVFMWRLGKQVMMFSNDLFAVKQKRDYLNSEISKAMDLVIKSFKK